MKGTEEEQEAQNKKKYSEKDESSKQEKEIQRKKERTEREEPSKQWREVFNAIPGCIAQP